MQNDVDCHACLWYGARWSFSEQCNDFHGDMDEYDNELHGKNIDDNDVVVKKT